MDVKAESWTVQTNLPAYRFSKYISSGLAVDSCEWNDRLVSTNDLALYGYYFEQNFAHYFSNEMKTEQFYFLPSWKPTCFAV